jgi:hypothetical protein
LILHNRGSTACLVSQRIAPVVNRTEPLLRCFDLNRANPTGAPLRFPLRESPQFFKDRANPVQRQPDAGDCSIHAEVVSSRPCGYPCYLPFKVLALFSTRHTSVYNAHPSTHGAGALVDENQPTNTGRRDRELPFPQPPVRKVTASTPFAIAHSLKLTIIYSHSLGSNS